METYKGKPTMAFTVMDCDVVEFLMTVGNYGCEINRLPKFAIDSEYIEVSCNTVSHMVVLLDDWLGNHKRLSYASQKGDSDEIHHPTSLEELEEILENAFYIDLLGTYH